MLVLVLAARSMGRVACFAAGVGVALVWVALADARCLPVWDVGIERSVGVSDGLLGVGWHVWACSG